MNLHGEIFEGLPKGGTAIINGDANYADLLVERADERQARVVLFGSANVPEVTPEGEGCRVRAEVGGKKLDFLVQEMNREANTIGSKANDVSMAQIVVNIKSEIEKIREQIQNIE